MLSQHYIDMTSQKSAIRELFDYGSKRAKEIGYENVFDYSLGNPSVPAPQEFTDALLDLIRNTGCSARIQSKPWYPFCSSGDR